MRTKPITRRLLIALLLALVLSAAGCRGADPTIPADRVTPPADATAAPADATAAPADATAAPTEAPADPTVAPITSVQIVLIALEDPSAGEPIGCNDGAVAVEAEPGAGDDPLEAAINALLDVRDVYYGESGLYNVFHQSDLKIAQIERTASGTTLALEGTLRLAGTCDTPRVKAQLEMTAELAEGRPVAVTINGQTLDEALSTR